MPEICITNTQQYNNTACTPAGKIKNSTVQPVRAGCRQTQNTPLCSDIYLVALIITLLMSALCVPEGLSAADLTPADYYTVEEYQNKHPAQRRTMLRFQTRVRAAGLPLGRQMPKVRIAFIYPGIQASDYWRRSVASFQGRMDEIGVDYEMLNFFTRPSMDIRLQEAQIREALASDPDYIVFTLDVGRHRRLVERLLSKKRPKVIMQNITTPLRAWEGQQPFLYVGFDHVKGTRMLAEHFKLQYPSGASYALLYFSKGYISTMRGDSFERLLPPQWIKQSSYYTDGSKNKAKHATLDILSTQKVDVLYTCATDVALGAIEALQQTNMIGKVVINGWGGGSPELEAIQKGKLDVTVMRMNDDNGVAMAEAIRLDLEGRNDEIPRIYSGDFTLIRKGVSEARLNELKSKAFRYSKNLQ